LLRCTNRNDEFRIEVDVDTVCGPAPKPPFMRLFDLPSSPV
jgi:hypothetical protein